MKTQDSSETQSLTETVREVYTDFKSVFKEAPYIPAGVGIGSGIFSYLAFRQSDYASGVTLGGLGLAATIVAIDLVSERVKKYREIQRAEELWKTYVEPALEERGILPYRH